MSCDTSFTYESGQVLQLRLSLTALLHMLGLSVELHGRVPVTWLVPAILLWDSSVCELCLEISQYLNVTTQFTVEGQREV